MANVVGDDRLAFLQDGQLNIHITDDTAVDYAVLLIEVIPEPATLVLLALGAVAVFRRRRMVARESASRRSGPSASETCGHCLPVTYQHRGPA